MNCVKQQEILAQFVEKHEDATNCAQHYPQDVDNAVVTYYN